MLFALIMDLKTIVRVEWTKKKDHTQTNCGQSTATIASVAHHWVWKMTSRIEGVPKVKLSLGLNFEGGECSQKRSSAGLLANR